MKRAVILSAALSCCACAGKSPEYVLQYDLRQLAEETALRDASPGFDSLPTSVGKNGEVSARRFSAATR